MEEKIARKQNNKKLTDTVWRLHLLPKSLFQLMRGSQEVQNGFLAILVLVQLQFPVIQIMWSFNLVLIFSEILFISSFSNFFRWIFILYKFLLISILLRVDNVLSEWDFHTLMEDIISISSSSAKTFNSLGLSLKDCKSCFLYRNS